jgi:hypothetical protein
LIGRLWSVVAVTSIALLIWAAIYRHRHIRGAARNAAITIQSAFTTAHPHSSMP